MIMRKKLQKTSLIVMLAIFGLSNIANAQWEILNSGVTSGLNAVFFTNPNTGYVAGASGVVLKTTDAGMTWNPLSIGKKDEILSIYFVNENVGFLTSSAGNIFKTTDAGLNWTAQITEVPGKRINDIHFFDENIGIAVGANGGTGMVLQTTNGGTTWKYLLAGGSYGENSVFLVSQTTAYSGGAYEELQRHQNINTSYSSYTSLTFSQDGGFSKMYFTNENTGYLAGSNGKVKKTIDACSSWEIYDSGLPSIASIHFSGSDTAMVVESWGNGISYTTDAGLTWTSHETSVSSDILTGVFLTSGKTAYVVGWGGLIMKTSAASTVNLENIKLKNEVSIFPNPTTGKFKIEIPQENKNLKFEVFNIVGEKVLAQNSNEIDLSNHLKGIYFVTISSDERVISTKKIVLQ